MEIKETQNTQEVSTIISEWCPTEQLHIVDDFFNDNIDYCCVNFEDVVRLNKEMARVGQKYRIFDCTQTALDVIQSFLTNLEIIQIFLGEIEASLQDSQSCLDELRQGSNKLKQEVLQLSEKVQGVNAKEVELTKRRETAKKIRETIKTKVMAESGRQKLKKFTYESDFDENGILYWLGTTGKTTPYINPCKIPSLALASESFSSNGNGVIAFGHASDNSNYIPANDSPGWFQI